MLNRMSPLPCESLCKSGSANCPINRASATSKLHEGQDLDESEFKEMLFPNHDVQDHQGMTVCESGCEIFADQQGVMHGTVEFPAIAIRTCPMCSQTVLAYFYRKAFHAQLVLFDSLRIMLEAITAQKGRWCNGRDYSFDTNRLKGLIESSFPRIDLFIDRKAGLGYRLLDSESIKSRRR